MIVLVGFLAVVLAAAGGFASWNGSRAAIVIAREARTEREMLMRALIARNMPEFAALQKIDAAGRRPAMTKAQVESEARALLESMGEPVERVFATPEGL